jgi:hypothetical protein
MSRRGGLHYCMHRLLGDDAGDGCALKRHDTTLTTSSGEEIGLLQGTRACVAAPDRGGLGMLSPCVGPAQALQKPSLD